MRKPITKKVLIGFDAELIWMIDDWRRKHADRPMRATAVRRLVAQALAWPPSRQTNPKAASQASKMAGREVDRLANPSVPAEEQAKRKGRLLKGPREFRDIRKDHSKSER